MTAPLHANDHAELAAEVEHLRTVVLRQTKTCTEHVTALIAAEAEVERLRAECNAHDVEIGEWQVASGLTGNECRGGDPSDITPGELAAWDWPGKLDAAIARAEAAESTHPNCATSATTGRPTASHGAWSTTPGRTGHRSCSTSAGFGLPTLARTAMALPETSSQTW